MKNVLIILFLLPCILNAQVTRTIGSFGGVGDGTTDNYNAFNAAAAFAKANDNTTITFPAGTFYIAQYRTIKNDPIDHIYWDDCVNLKLQGVPGTIISMNGTFFRPLDYVVGADCARKSYTSGLSPFWFRNCDGLEISTMEITGNVQNTTRLPGADENSPSVTESSNILLRFTKCNDVIIDSMYLHHAECDGILISGDRVNGVWINSTNFTVTNVRSENNGRQGMSAGGLSDGYFQNCDFKYTGFTGGTYGHNDPSAGVDIEPGEFHFTSNITFEDCTWEGNYGNQLICSYPNTSSNLTLRRCSVIVTGLEKPQGITVLVNRVLFDSCYISLLTRDFKITNVDKPGAKTTIRNSTIEATGNWILTQSNDMTDSIHIEGNQFNYMSNVMTSPFMTLRSRNLRFLDNDIYIPEAALTSRATSVVEVYVENAIISQGNNFHSENPLINPTVSYTGTTTVNDP